MMRPPPRSPFFPYPPLSRSAGTHCACAWSTCHASDSASTITANSNRRKKCNAGLSDRSAHCLVDSCNQDAMRGSIRETRVRSEEHTSELQSHLNLVCRLLLE